MVETHVYQQIESTVRGRPLTEEVLQKVMNVLGSNEVDGESHACNLFVRPMFSSAGISRLKMKEGTVRRTVVIHPLVLNMPSDRVLGVVCHEYRHQFWCNQELTQYEKEFDADKFAARMGYGVGLIRHFRKLKHLACDTHPSSADRITRLEDFLYGHYRNPARLDVLKHSSSSRPLDGVLDRPLLGVY